MSRSHGPARDPDPTEAFGGTAPMEVDQRPGVEQAADEDRPEAMLGAGSAAMPPRGMEDVPTARVADMVRGQREPGR
ncbi:hypothetical protein HER39_09935 [Arthrobacter deserti]|uniref:Uncharacterized protein n=1 Tax=Arthrobacter deserti TaxID=1742687 RepID=A0ABX1JQE7_9MICC|nr:hypothetical protein [Arthrobacter deserti]